jgi:ABC-type proline/glycine betaine transport system substrate-binding protein
MSQQRESNLLYSLLIFVNYTPIDLSILTRKNTFYARMVASGQNDVFPSRWVNTDESIFYESLEKNKLS